MGILREFRSSLENPSTPLSFPAELLLDVFNGGRTDSGIRVSELTALQIAAVYSCVDLISAAMASLDLNVYERLLPAGKRLAWEHDVHDLLHDEPNPEMTAFTMWRTFLVHALLWTNAYIEIERDQANRPIGMWPRTPIGTKPRRTVEPITIDGEKVPIGTLVFETTDSPITEDNQPKRPRYILAGNMIHVPGLSLDGRLGKPVIELTRQVMGLALAAEKFGGKYFANGIRPPGWFELPADMAAPAIENFRRSVNEAYGGENMLRSLITEAGIKFTPFEIKANEAQFLETRKYQREEIAAIFHVPVRMIGDAGRVNRSSAEQEAIELVQYTLRPWIKAIQPELKRKLFPKVGRTAGKYFPAFYYQDMLTPDSESRGKLIALLKQWGVANSDDIRENFMDWNPIGGAAGQTYWMPVNMMDASKPLELAPPDPAAAASEGDSGDGGQNPKDAQNKRRLIQPFSGLFQQAFERVSGNSGPDLTAFRRAFQPVLSAVAGAAAMVNPLGIAVHSCEASPELCNFIDDYVSGMHKRFHEWKSDPAGELARAGRAINVAVYRDLATQQAKRENEGAQHEEQTGA